MMQCSHIPWQSPEALARAIAQQSGDMIFLHSTLDHGFSGNRSFLLFSPEEHIIADDFEAFSTALSHDQSKYDNAWFGYLGYGLKNCIEQLPEDSPSIIAMPELWMTRFQHIVVFKHDTEQCQLWSSSATPPALPSPVARSDLNITVEHITSNMRKEEYLKHVENTIEDIHAGEIFQANITRKFHGNFVESPDAFELFANLCEISPAPYSCYLRLGDTHIISSSPEQFLSVDSCGKASSRPIKGTAPRFEDSSKDAASRKYLEVSEKDKAENLMIVDLMRNDFSRSCLAESVQVEELFNISSYKTVHHMASTILGTKREDVRTLDLVKSCFPPGSMTGAPKIRAMELCSEREKIKRNIYSGAIGWFGGDGSCDLSVVIRTLVVRESQFEFQVGGAIVADSTPESEWEETLVKARGICALLSITPEKDLCF